MAKKLKKKKNKAPLETEEATNKLKKKKKKSAPFEAEDGEAKPSASPPTGSAKKKKNKKANSALAQSSKTSPAQSPTSSVKHSPPVVPAKEAPPRKLKKKRAKETPEAADAPERSMKKQKHSKKPDTNEDKFVPADSGAKAKQKQLINARPPNDRNALKVFVGGIPFTTDEKTIRRDFSECGEVADLVCVKDKDGKFKGSAFITFKTTAAVENALDLDGDEYGGRVIKVKVATNKEDPERESQLRDRSRGSDKNHLKVFVGGIPFGVDEETIREDFGVCGEIDELVCLRDDQDRFKGIAFITFKTKAGVEAALKYDGDDYGGRTLKVAMASGRSSSQGASKGDKEDKGKGKGKGKDKGKSKGKDSGKSKGEKSADKGKGKGKGKKGEGEGKGKKGKGKRNGKTESKNDEDTGKEGNSKGSKKKKLGFEMSSEDE